MSVLSELCADDLQLRFSFGDGFLFSEDVSGWKDNGGFLLADNLLPAIEPPVRGQWEVSCSDSPATWPLLSGITRRRRVCFTRTTDLLNSSKENDFGG